MNNTIQLGKYADILMDRWFKRTFGWAPAKRLLTLFLQELIPERTIVDLSYGPQEFVNPVTEGKDIRVDVECTDVDGTLFVVEMQLATQTGFYNRAVFNSTFAVQQQIPIGSRSFDYPAVYFIGIMNFSVHKGSNQVLFRYTIQEKTSHELMTDRLQYIFLELPNCSKALTDQATVIDNFCYVLHNIGKMEERPEGLDGEIYDLLFNSAEITNFTATEHQKYLEDMTTKEDIQRMIAYAEDHGKEEGRAEGEAKGRAEEKTEMALRFLELGVPMETVSKASGISIEELEKAQQKVAALRAAIEEGENSGYVESFDADAHLKELKAKRENNG